MTMTPARLWRGLSGLLVIGGQVVLAFMTVTICYDTIMRYLFAQPTSWSLEINTFLIVYLAVMTAAEVQRTDEHIKIEFFVDRLPPRGRALARALTGVAGVIFCGVLVWRGWILAYQAWEYGERVSSSLGTPMVLPYAMLPIGFAMLGLQFAIQTVEALHAGWRGSDREPRHA